jgi:uncharacterized small protein (DUF1192 family)
MDMDDLEPRKKTPMLKNLDPMSIEELRDYIIELKDEIARAEQAITAKQAVKMGAEAFFKR